MEFAVGHKLMELNLEDCIRIIAMNSTLLNIDNLAVTLDNKPILSRLNLQIASGKPCDYGT